MSNVIFPRFTSGPTSGPHRYWRLVVGRASGGSTNLASDKTIGAAEIELRETVGGPDVTGSGTATASSETVGHELSKAFANDGDTTNYVSSASTLPCTIQYDFGAGVTKSIVEVAIMPTTTGGNSVSYTPGAFKVQSSDDGATWNDEWWVVYPGGANGWNYTAGAFVSFTRPLVDQSPAANRHLYFRLSITGSNGGNPFYVGAREIILKTVSGSIDETILGTPTSRSAFSGLPVAQAFDAMNLFDNLTEWASNNVGFPEWIQYQFAQPTMIAEVTYHARSGNETTQSPTGIDFQVSDNGSSWTTVKSVTPASWGANPIQTWTIP
jgi:hypothetical protein